MKVRVNTKKSFRSWMLLLLLVSVATVYARGLAGSFVNDDRTYFIDNDLLTQLQPWDLTDIFLHPSNYWGELLPLRDFLYVVQFRLFGENPYGYHVVSLLLYLAIVIVVWKLIPSVCVATSTANYGKWEYLFVVSAFALHPVHVESVAYISGQKDLLCALFSLLALLLFFRMLAYEKYLNLKIFFGFLVCYYGAFLSKGLAVATAMLLTICGFLLLRHRKRFWSHLVPLWVVINVPVIVWLVYIMSVSAVAKSMGSLVDISVIEHIVRAVRISGRHFMLAVWPEPLSFGYPFDPGAFVDGPFLAGICGLILLLSLFVLCRNFMTRFAVLLILLYLLPVSQLFYELFNASIYDRYLFVPMLGVAILAGRGGALLHQYLPLWIVQTGAATLLALLAFQTYSYVPVYNSDLAVAKRASALYPQQSSSFFNYAVALIESGAVDEAEKLIAKTDQKNQPAWVCVYLNGWIAFERGDLNRAVPLLRLAYWQCVAGGYYPFPGVLLAEALLVTGDVRTVRLILDQVMHSTIHNPVEYYKAKQLQSRLAAAE